MQTINKEIKLELETITIYELSLTRPDKSVCIVSNKDKKRVISRANDYIAGLGYHSPVLIEKTCTQIV